MPVQPAAFFLKDFRASPQPAAIEQARPEPEPAVPDPAIELAALRSRVSALEAELEGLRDEARVTLADQLEQQRRRLDAEAGVHLLLRLEEARAKLADDLAASLEDVIAPLLEVLVRRRAIEELKSVLASLWTGEGGIAVHVSGPCELVDGLRDGLPGFALSLEVADMPELVITMGRTRVETALRDWSERHLRGGTDG